MDIKSAPDKTAIINVNLYETIKEFAHCTLCKGIIIDPMQCFNCEACFCKKCIDLWSDKSKNCPKGCENSNYKESKIAKTMLSKLIFECQFGCKRKINYEEYYSHQEKCKNKETECLCCKSMVKQGQIINDALEAGQKMLNKENETLKLRLKDLETLLYKQILFPNGSKLFKTEGGIKLRTITSNIPLPEVCCISIKLIKLYDPAYVAFGISDKILNVERGYIGGDLGSGNWGIAGNGSLGADGKWLTVATGFQEGDILTIIKNQSNISYKINGQIARQIYELNKNSLYFGLSYYYSDDLFEIIE